MCGRGHVWQGACLMGELAWQEGHAWQGGMCGEGHGW